MIQNNRELRATLDRIERFQKQVEKLREVETDPHNYKLSAGGFLAEIDRMNLEVQRYLIGSIYMPIMSETNMRVDSPYISASNVSSETSETNVRVDSPYIPASNVGSETFFVFKR